MNKFVSYIDTSIFDSFVLKYSFTANIAVIVPSVILCFETSTCAHVR